MLYNTVIEYPKEIEDKLKQICLDIKATSEKKGEEFNYKFENGKLIIGSQSGKKSWGRGFWFKQHGIYVDNYDEGNREKVKENRRLKRQIRFSVVQNGTQ